MPTEADYQQRIADYTAPQLLELWGQIQSGETPGWEPGKALEYLVVRAFEIEDASVRYPFSVQLEGTVVEQIDGVVFSDGLSCLVECKDQVSNISIDPIAKLRNQLLRRPARAIGLMFSTTDFTSAAIILAQYSGNQAILLWDGQDLEYALRHRQMRIGLLKKYRYCIERGSPSYSLKIGDLA
jgi:Restriction endonuclease